MGHNSGERRAELIEGLKRDAASRELAADAVALVEKWNAELKQRRGARAGNAERQRLPQFSPHIGAAILAGKPWLRLLCPCLQPAGSARSAHRGAAIELSHRAVLLTC